MGHKYLYIAFGILLGIFVGWLIGSKQEAQIVEAVRYIERPATKIDTELFPKPIKVERIDLPHLYYTDTVRVVEQLPADTAGIVADYLQRRRYELDFSTDTTGVYKVQAVIECNRLKSASATIIPLQREQQIAKVRNFRPYIGGGLAIGQKFGATLEVGALLKDKHLPSVGYLRMGESNYIMAKYGYIF